ncbi:MAG: LysR family transcriptional regulator [Negativicutes bacterium]
MEIHQLQYVIELAKKKHFTRAADEIFVGQSTLSQQIAKLESELGVKLFNRTTHAVTPTAAGLEFIRYAQQILSTIESAKQCMQAYTGLLKGTLRIGAITSLESIDFVNMLAKFHDCHPMINLNMLQAGSYKLIELLQTCEIDIAFLTLPPKSNYNDLDIFHLTDDDYLLVIPDDHPFAKRKIIDLAAAANEKFIFHYPDQSISDICLQACRNAGFEPLIFCRTSHGPTSLSMISAKMGIGFFPAKEIEYYARPGITTVQLLEPLKKHIMLVMPKKQNSLAVNAFHRFVEEWVDQLKQEKYNNQSYQTKNWEQ